MRSSINVQPLRAMRVDECEVWIACEGQRLPEYDTQPEGDDRKTFACFIPSDAGKTFALGWQNHSANNSLRFTVKVDGTHVGGRWYYPQEKGSLIGVHISTTMLQPFQFSPLETTDADDALHAPTNADLGSIRVRVERIKPMAPVHKCSKKLGAHRVTLGEAIKTKATSRWNIELVEPESGPLVEFVFRYRPLALLQAQEITPPPILSSTGQDSQDDDDARPANIRKHRFS